MAAVQRVGDFNSRGGIIQSGEDSVRVNGRAIAVISSPVSPHPPCPKIKKHCKAFTDGGNPRVLANGKPIILEGDSDTCGDSRTGGSNNVKSGTGS